MRTKERDFLTIFAPIRRFSNYLVKQLSIKGLALTEFSTPTSASSRFHVPVLSSCLKRPGVMPVQLLNARLNAL